MNLTNGKQYRVDIDGKSYGMSCIESGEIVQELFEQAGVGGTCCAELRMALWNVPSPRRMAKVQPFVRDAEDGDWTALGTFWIDQRTENGARLEITAYDVMMSAEALWQPGETRQFPMPMEKAAQIIARTMGTSLDERCAFQPYTLDYPAEGYTMRETLGYIAAAHAGNWFVTAEGKLLLAPLFGSMPPESRYLVTDDGDAIAFGGTRILI